MPSKKNKRNKKKGKGKTEPLRKGDTQLETVTVAHEAASDCTSINTPYTAQDAGFGKSSKRKTHNRKDTDEDSSEDAPLESLPVAHGATATNIPGSPLDSGQDLEHGKASIRKKHNRKPTGEDSSKDTQLEALSGTHEAAADVPTSDPGTVQDVEKLQQTEMTEGQKDSFSGLEKNRALMKRPGYGILGKKISLIVNYFPVELPSGVVYHYDIGIYYSKKRGSRARDLDAPEWSEKADEKLRCKNATKNRKIFDILLKKFAHLIGCLPAYDGQKNLYSKKPLNGAPLAVFVELPVNRSGIQSPEDRFQGPDIFKVVVKPTKNNVINLDSLHELYKGCVNEVPQEATMAMETILGNGPCFRYIPLGRSFFFPPQSPKDMHPLSGGKEIWFGYHQSLIMTEWKPVVNINPAATTFHKSESVRNYVCYVLHCTVDDLYNIPMLTEAEINQLTKELSGVKIAVTHLPYRREHDVIRFTPESANRLKFEIVTKEGSHQTTVADYYMDKYKMKLLYPQLPCLQVHPKKKKIYLPLEVCEIIQNQHSKKPLTDSQTREMIKVASVPPEKHFEKTQQILRRTNFNEDPWNTEFGISVSSEPLKPEGRVIRPPNLMYKNNETGVMPKDGSWSMKDLKFFEGAKVCSWVMLSFVDARHCSRGVLSKFADDLSKSAQRCGITIESPECVEIFGSSDVLSVQNILKRFSGTKLAVVVLQGKNSPLYSKIKHVAETDLGLVTQCVQVANVLKPSTSVMVNICQKINAKMGGINNSLTPGERPMPAILDKPVIIIGADVTHPPPESQFKKDDQTRKIRKPSIAAVVGSLNRNPSRYAVVYRCQWNTNDKKESVEIIQDLKNMVMELLKAFYRSTRGQKPEKILFYRDGVSDGQLMEVRNYELSAIRDACLSLQPDYQPGITFIVVQKRHHTRFKPEDPSCGVGKMRNVPPGTVVDRGITSHSHFDFFLCSHFGLQGTSRPGHYIVVDDDNKFTVDDLQALTYSLCYTYARCTKSISIPAPVAYADLVAYRVAKYLDTKLKEYNEDSTLSEDDFRSLINTLPEIIAIKPELRDTMYFV